MPYKFGSDRLFCVCVFVKLSTCAFVSQNSHCRCQFRKHLYSFRPWIYCGVCLFFVCFVVCLGLLLFFVFCLLFLVDVLFCLEDS